MTELLTVLKFIGTLLVVLLIFNFVILVHEWGHFLAARWRGLKIEKFQIWMGKPIWKKTYNGVQYGLGSLPIGGFVALGVIVVGAIFGFNLGLWFSLAMVGLASASILYETYNIKNVYSKGQYVGAALQMFSSIMLLFWYILRIFMSRRS